ncbi:pseudouridine synthase [Citreicoccus inhibens]|uniref:pseudouridine synthase n=1 Tax=Citreicoccus inhibens TaxID=2849499 RepID=UPI002E2D999E|nr:pseudouridine synthase [Citreicoccus inhibens]
MSELVTYFEPQPAPGEVPVRLPSPFREDAPHPLARRAAEALQRELRRGVIAPAVEARVLAGAGQGKMFGVLVVASPDGRLGHLRAFSGMLAERWWIAGYVPPLFDAVAREALWETGDATLALLSARYAELTHGPEVTALRERLSWLEAARGVAASRQRADGRASDAERIREALRALAVRRETVARARAEFSRELWRRNARTYVFRNARGEQQTLDAMYAPLAPPGGAGDCAAPKLLGAAYGLGLRPVAFAEFWWGGAPASGDRREGAFYPACRAKCGDVLPFMLQGLDAEPAPPVERGAPAALRFLFEDSWLLVLEKPAGLPCSPNRHARERDSVLTRLRQRSPPVVTPHFARRLEPESSGLMVVSKDAQTHAALMRQFALQEAHVSAKDWGHVQRADEHGLKAWPLGSRGAADARTSQHVDALSFRHPHTGARLTFDSPLPFD